MESESDNLLIEFINIAIQKDSNEAEQFLFQNFCQPHKIQLRKLIQVMNEFHSRQRSIKSFEQTKARYDKQISQLKKQLHDLRSLQFSQKFGKQKKKYQILLSIQNRDLQVAISKAKEIKSKQLQLIAEHLNQYDYIRKIAKENLESYEFTKIVKFIKSNIDYTKSMNNKLINFCQSNFCQALQVDLSTPYFSTKCKENLNQLKQYIKNYRLITQQQQKSNRNTLIQLCHKKGFPIKNDFASFSELFKKIAPLLVDEGQKIQNASEGENISLATSQQNQNIQKIEMSIKAPCKKCQELQIELQKSDEIARREKENRENLTKQLKKTEKASIIFENNDSYEYSPRQVSKSIRIQDSRWNQKYLASLKIIQELQTKILQLQKIIKQNVNKRTVYEDAGQEVQQMDYEHVANSNEEPAIRILRQFAIARDLIEQIRKKKDEKRKKEAKLLEETLLRLQKLCAQREEQFQTEKTYLAKNAEQIERQNRQLGEQNDILKDRIQQSPQSPFLFPIGFIFKQEDINERNFLLKTLSSNIKEIKGTRLIYRADPLNSVNFHRYIDGIKHIVFIAKTVTGRLIAAYSAAAFVSGATQKDFGLILSLSNNKSFVIKDKKAITYDDFFMIFGNSELRLKTQEYKLFSNFGLPSGYYDCKGEKVNALLGLDKQREIDLVEYEFYQLIVG